MAEEFKTQTPLDEQSKAPVIVEETTPQFVTNEQLQAYGEQLANNMKAAIGRIPSMIDEKMKSNTTQLEQKETPVVEENVDPKTQVMNMLKQERELLELDRMKVNKQKVRSGLEAAFLENGVDPAKVKMVVDSQMLRNQEKFNPETNDLGESNTTFKADEYAEPVPLNDYVKTFMLTTEGQSIALPKKSPSVNVPHGRGPVNGEVKVITNAEANSMDPKLLTNGLYRIEG
ncbi:hypothetical protein KAR91_01555 [Candidatus Pacearchaeota archaeon]|nr:hypothetical protein [Candidatus Pacearchaeota archaeon]